MCPFHTFSMFLFKGSKDHDLAGACVCACHHLHLQPHNRVLPALRCETDRGIRVICKRNLEPGSVYIFIIYIYTYIYI